MVTNIPNVMNHSIPVRPQFTGLIQNFQNINIIFINILFKFTNEIINT